MLDNIWQGFRHQNESQSHENQGRISYLDFHDVTYVCSEFHRPTDILSVIPEATLLARVKNRIIMFTWVIILTGAEVKGGLGALQTHLPPVCDSLQLHSVTAVLFQSLQIYPVLSL